MACVEDTVSTPILFFRGMGWPLCGLKLCTPKVYESTNMVRVTTIPIRSELRITLLAEHNH